MALNKHQVGIALLEAERALDLAANEVDALKAKSRALIYSGRYEEGRKLANRIIRLDPVALAEPLYLIGLAYFAEGNYAKAADYVKRAVQNDPTTDDYLRLMVASYGKLGMQKEARESLRKYRIIWPWPYWTAFAVYSFPFQDGAVLEHLADGFHAAGLAQKPPSRYLKFDRETRLTGTEIKALLFGHSIRGQDYRVSTVWDQIRNIDGKVTHTGGSIHTGNRLANEQAEGWIDENRLCERWFGVDGDVTICVLIFRASAGDENDYYMLTDQGPQPFRVLN
jgi:tetratricopeptide (TPR) repeat protein